MSVILYLLFICQFLSQDVYAQYANNYMSDYDNRTIMSQMLIKLSMDVLHSSMRTIKTTYKARYDNQLSAPYEVGYLTQTLHEFFRRMLDKWYAAHLMTTDHYNIELTLYLQDIEHHYWAIKHVSNMMHEIERKYKVKGGLDDSYEYPRDFVVTMPALVDIFKAERDAKISQSAKQAFKNADVKKQKKMFIANGLIMTTTKRKRGPGRFPIDYGNDIYDWNSNT